MPRATVAAAWLLCVTVGCGSGGAGAGTPGQPSAPADDSSATFTLRGAGYSGTPLSYTNARGGLVFCRRQTGRASYLWIRLAAERNADGGNGPHVDMDLCNFSGSGRYAVVHDVTGGLACTQGASWDIYWHDGARVFVSRPGASPCEVVVTASGTALEGTFQCQGLTRTDGSNEALDVLGGSFRCSSIG